MPTRKQGLTWTDRSYTPGAADTFSVGTLQEDLEKLDESSVWVRPDSPPAPVAGDLWSDTDSGLLKLYSGGAWTALGPGMVRDVRAHGAVMGTGVSGAQMLANLDALHAAVAACDDAGGGLVAIPGGTLLLDGTPTASGALINLEDRPNSTVGLVGMATTTSGATLKYGGTGAPRMLLSLKGSRQVTIRDLALDGGGKCLYGLYCARNAAKDTAGKHYFEGVYATGCTVGSHLNWGSEENTYLKCRFQGSAIGAIFTGYEIDDTNAPTVGADPIVSGKRDNPASSASGGNWDDSTAHHLYDCALGDTSSSRCGLLVQSSQLLMFGGAIQAAAGTSEAYVILDGTRQGALFSGVTLDSGLANIGWKVGAYSSSAAAASNFVTQAQWSGGSWTINGTTGTAYMDAKNLVGCVVSAVTCRGRTPAASYGINLLDNACRANVFQDVIYGGDAAATSVIVTNGGTALDNLQMAQGAIRFIAPSGSTSPTLSYSGSGAVKVQNQLTLNPPVGSVAENILRQGESTSTHSVNHLGTHSWGDGTSAVDTTLQRQGAGLLRATNTTFQALNWSEATFTETTGAGVYTGSVSVPAGAWLVDIKVISTALWTATTSAVLKVGDVADDDGWYTAIDLKATDLLVGEEISFDQPGGKQGAYLDNSTGKRSPAYSAAARTISGIVTTVGAAGSAGRTRMLVIFASPISAAAAKV